MARPRHSTASYPAPTKGKWSAQNAAEPETGTAIVLKNWFTQTDKVRLRRGSGAYATGAGAGIDTLIPYEVGSTRKLFAAAGGSIRDATAPGTMPAPAVTGLGSSLIEHAIFATSGGLTYVVAVNGVDNRLLYDGSTWSNLPAMTGVAASSLSHVWSYRNRLFFAEKGTLNAAYLPVDSVGGELIRFPLGGVVKRGGELIAGASWSIDASNALEEGCVFLTSEGEVAVFSGTDPSDAAKWTLRGVYSIGKPLGRRCFLRAGGDLAIMTEDGLIPLSAAARLDRAALRTAAVTRPIEPDWRAAVTSAPATGWQITIWPRETMAIIVIPGTNRQFVANTTNGGWSDFEGWPATTFAVFDNRLFFGRSDGTVAEGDIGGNDFGQTYSGTIVWPFDGLRADAAVKVAHMARPMLESSGGIGVTCSVHADFVVDLPETPGPSLPTAGFRWSISRWGEEVWVGLSRTADWQPLSGIGSSLALGVQVTVNSAAPPDLRLSRMDMTYERGSVVV